MLLPPLFLFVASLTSAAELATDVDRIVADVLKTTRTPSASVAVVVDGKLVIAKAYGDARVEPKRVPATAEMRYPIGSISKQFVAAAVLLLVEEGKLGLDDPVSRFLPALTRSREVKVRDLLAHTSGYQDYYPQDFTPESMKRDVTPDEILARWAKKDLDFDPGTQWQYSNTGYVAAGRIVEIASGQPLFELLTQRIFTPLGMSVVDVAHHTTAAEDPPGYTRYGFSPLRPPGKEGLGWLYAAGQLSMTPTDLAKWNIAVLEKRILKPESYAVFHREVLLKNGLGTNYALGVGVRTLGDHRVLAHGGATAGYLATNKVFPDDNAAITVLTNDEVGDAGEPIANQIATLLFERKDGRAAAETRAKDIFVKLQKGKLDRSLFSENANAYFTEAVLKDIAASTKPLGAPTKVEQTSQKLRGGMLFRLMTVTTKKRTVTILERDVLDGKIEQFLITSQ